MFIIGVFLLLLSILIDEGSTLIIMLKGLGIFETNPIFTRFGLIPYILTMILLYCFIIWAWGFMIKQYHNAYERRSAGYKWLDVLVFFTCFMLIFISSAKIQTGYDNTEFLIKSYDADYQEQLNQNKITLQLIKEDNHAIYVAAGDKQYFGDIGYFQMIFVVIMSYLLLKVGHKVCPWENG